MAEPARSVDEIDRPSGPSARHRLNLIEQLRQDAVASDYAGQPPETLPRGGRTQRVLVAAVALALAGFVLALGVSARVINSPTISSQRQALIERIDATEAQVSALTAEVAVLRSRAATAQEDSLALTIEGRALDDRINDLALVTGYQAVRGPGAVVTLTDAPVDDEALSGGEDADLERVLDADIQLTVNGLWLAGAEAISVNGHRLTAQSAIRSAAGAILVNYRPLKPPYEVAAIGPQDLDQRFTSTADAAQLRALSEQFGIGLAVTPAQDLTLRPATTPLPEDATVGAGEEGAVQ